MWSDWSSPNKLDSSLYYKTDFPCSYAGAYTKGEAGRGLSFSLFSLYPYLGEFRSMMVARYNQPCRVWVMVVSLSHFYRSKPWAFLIYRPPYETVQDLIMQQFFTQENIERFLQREEDSAQTLFNVEPLLDRLDGKNNPYLWLKYGCIACLSSIKPKPFVCSFPQPTHSSHYLQTS